MKREISNFHTKAENVQIFLNPHIQIKSHNSISAVADTMDVTYGGVALLCSLTTFPSSDKSLEDEKHRLAY